MEKMTVHPAESAQGLGHEFVVYYAFDGLAEPWMDLWLFVAPQIFLHWESIDNGSKLIHIFKI
jgi:hypothetical protein